MAMAIVTSDVHLVPTHSVSHTSWCEQLTIPHPLQWCLLRVTVNCTLHSWHMLTELSGSHGGAKWPRGTLSVSSPTLSY